MTDSVKQNVPDLASASRFRFKFLFGAMATLSVLTGVGGVFIRDFAPDAKLHVVELWGSAIALFALNMARLIWIRQRAEKKVGAVYYRLKWALARGRKLETPWSHALTFIIIFAFYAVAFPLLAMAAQGDRPGPLYLLGACMGGMLASAVTTVWWRKECWIGERGVANMGYFWPWEQIIHWQHHKKKPNTIVLLSNKKFGQNQIAVHPSNAEKESLVKLLEEKVGPESKKILPFATPSQTLEE